jgi:hypothetical protein
LRGNAYAAAHRSNEITRRSHHQSELWTTDSGSIGGWSFEADPDQSFLEQTIFWAPEAVPTIVPVRPAVIVSSPHTHIRLDLNDLNESQLRQGPDGWHAVLHLRGVEHRIWFKDVPVVAAAYTVELPLDRDFEFRAGAGMRLWRGLNGRPQGASPHAISAHRRRRIALALRASDARADGATYREIAEVLLPAQRIVKREWRTHEVRDRIVRLVKTGFALVQGGYRALLRPSPRKK